MDWISVSDRLPDKPMNVIAYMADRGTVMLTAYVEDFALVRVEFETGFSEHGVTHWMPLPEPPKP